MHIICLDLEGVLIPEIWIGVAERTGIEELKLTTRDIADYDELMAHRLKILDKEGLGIKDISAVIDGLEPLDGAQELVQWIKQTHQLIILSDTFYQFAGPMMSKLDWPTLMCHHLNIADDGRIAGYELRQSNQKEHAVRAFRSLNFATVAAGDSYNDTTMLAAADAGILFRPPENVIAEFPMYPVVTTHEQLRVEIEAAVERTS